MPATLGKASSSQQCNSKLGTGILSASLIVTAHAKYKCCRTVEATFHLKPSNERKKREIGYAVAYIVDKTAADEDGNKLWLEELINTDCDDNEVPEVMNMMQTLSGPKGGVRKAFQAHARELKDGQIVHIDTLKLYEQFRSKSLGGIALNALHTLLPQLSNGHAFTGTIVLSPATPDDTAQGFEKKGQSAYEQEGILIGIYEKVGYDLWVRGAEDEESSMTVMGRRV